MNSQNFYLYPFSRADTPAGVKISGRITRHGNLMTLIYILSGPLHLIKIPAPALNPIRKDRIWEATCFELFFGMKTSERYWEFNFSPSGNWNVYRFNGYRRDMAKESAFANLPFSVKQIQDTLCLTMEIRLDQLFDSAAPLQAGICAVINTLDGDFFYFALTHPAPKPDFHHPAGFILEL